MLSRASQLSRDIGDQLHLQQGHLVFDLQFPFFQAAQLQFVTARLLNKMRDDLIQITMFNLQFDDALFNRFHVRHIFGGQTR